MNTKTSAGLIALSLVAAAAWWLARGDRAPPVAPPRPPPIATRPPAAAPAHRAPSAPARPAIEISDVDVIDGRVLDAASYAGVPDAKLVVRGDGGDATFTTSSDGTFELAPAATGERVLATITAPGYLPYSPVRAGVRLTLARGRGVHGVTLVMERRAPPRARLAPFDATITGHVRDAAGAPLAGAVVRAAPSIRAPVATVTATTGADGGFTLAGVDRGAYDVAAEADGHIRGARDNVLGGSRNVELTLDAGLPLAGRVVDDRGAPVPVFTLIVHGRFGVRRPSIASRSLIDPQGRFALRVPPGDYEVVVDARGFARNAPVPAVAGATDLRIALGGGATVRGKVIASDDRAPVVGARVAYEFTPERNERTERTERTIGDPEDASVRAATRADGSFELSGLPTGPVALWINAEGFRAKLEAGMTARDGAAIGPITIALTRLGPDAEAGVDMVGIGVQLVIDGDALQIAGVLPGSGAFDAGVEPGDRLIAVDGVPVGELGMDGALARIHGQSGTPIVLTVRREGRDVELAVERRPLRT